MSIIRTGKISLPFHRCCYQTVINRWYLYLCSFFGIQAQGLHIQARRCRGRRIPISARCRGRACTVYRSEGLHASEFRRVWIEGSIPSIPSKGI